MGFVALVDLNELRGWDISEIEQVIGSAKDAGTLHPGHIAVRH